MEILRSIMIHPVRKCLPFASNQRPPRARLFDQRRLGVLDPGDRWAPVGRAALDRGLPSLGAFDARRVGWLLISSFLLLV